MLKIIYPITGEEVKTIQEPTDEELSQIFNKAKQSARNVAKMPLAKRIEIVKKLQHWIVENQEKIIDHIVKATGKARFDALSSEIFSVCEVLEYFSKKAPKILKERKVHTPITLLGKKSRIYYEPLGVILVITPWNYPFYQGIVPSVLAFLAGNSVILKPSEITPMPELWEMITPLFPENSFNVVFGGKETGEKLVKLQPDKIHFTGSVAGGKSVMKTAAEFLIPLDLELGGKDPAIVFDDVNLERTVNGIIWGALTNTGQSCTAIERVYVQDKIYDKFISALVEKVKKLRISNENSDVTSPDAYDIGPFISRSQVKIVREQLLEAVEKGAKILYGKIPSENDLHVLPVVLTEVNHSMKIMTEETFGPVIPVMKFSTEEEAVKLANDTIYGLGASVWTKDNNRAIRITKALKVGNVSVNNHMLTEANPALPFGGVKQSGFGRFKGDEGLLTFCNVKSVLIDKQSGTPDPHWYPYTKTKYSLLTSLTKALFGKPKNWLKFVSVGLKLDSIGKKEKL